MWLARVLKLDAFKPSSLLRLLYIIASYYNDSKKNAQEITRVRNETRKEVLIRLLLFFFCHFESYDVVRRHVKWHHSEFWFVFFATCYIMSLCIKLQYMTLCYVILRYNTSHSVASSNVTLRQSESRFVTSHYATWLHVTWHHVAWH